MGTPDLTFGVLFLRRHGVEGLRAFSAEEEGVESKMAGPGEGQGGEGEAEREGVFKPTGADVEAFLASGEDAHEHGEGEGRGGEAGEEAGNEEDPAESFAGGGGEGAGEGDGQSHFGEAFGGGGEAGTVEEAEEFLGAMIEEDEAQGDAQQEEARVEAHALGVRGEEGSHGERIPGTGDAV